MCDEIKYHNAKEAWFHRKDDIFLLANVYGFKAVYSQDITNKVIPTRHFALEQFIHNKDSMIRELSDKRKNVREEIDSLIKGWSDFTKMFEDRSCGYEIYLFRFRKDKVGNVLLRIRNGFLLVSYLFVTCIRKVFKKIS